MLTEGDYHLLTEGKNKNIHQPKLPTFIKSHEELLLGVESRTALYAGFDIAVAANTPTGSPAGNKFSGPDPLFTPYSN